jgi:hypothetical protein
MADYHTSPLRVTASSTGGADVDVSATLFVDDEVGQEADTTLVDVHRSEKRGSIRASKEGDTKLRVLYIVVPLVGNGEFEVTLTLAHPNVQGGSLTFTKRGDVGDAAPKVFRNTFTMP